MARKSKSPKNNENSEISEDVDTSGVDETGMPKEGESTSDAPVVIEGKAEDVTDLEGADEPKSDDALSGGETPEDGTSAEDAVDAEDNPDQDATSEEETEEGEPSEGALAEAQEANPVAVHDTANETPEAKSSTPVVALVLGGIVAGAIGFFGASLAPSPPPPEFDTSAIDAGIGANSDAVAALAEEVAGLQSSPGPDLSGVEDQLASITQSLESIAAGLSDVETALADTTADLNAKVTALDDRMLLLETAVPSSGAASTGDELAALRERIAEMTAAAEDQLAAAQAEAASVARAAEEARLAAEAEAAELRAEAEAREAELEAAAERQAAIIDLKAAVEAGSPFAEHLGALDSVPEVLANNADTGVPTILALQESFPDAARAALAQSSLVGEDASAGELFTAFLKSRTNARSLTPREGDGPDAVLSRAEAALGVGDLRGALSELDALGEDGKDAMAEWVNQANTRLSAIAAIDQLSSATN